MLDPRPRIQAFLTSVTLSIKWPDTPDLPGGSNWSRGFASFSVCSLRNPGLRECGCVYKGPQAELPSQLCPRTTLQPALHSLAAQPVLGSKRPLSTLRDAETTRRRATWYHKWPQEGARFLYYFQNGICESTILHIHSEVKILTLKISAYSLTDHVAL